MKYLISLVFCGGVLSLATLEPTDPVPSATPATQWNTYRHRFESTQHDLDVLSAGSCTGCHKDEKPRPGERFIGDEWMKWWNEGKGVHFRAFKVLSDDDRSDRMVKLLYGPQAVARDQAECLACHALSVPEKSRTRAFEIQDGVTCEACHGRSEKWNGPHQNPATWRELTIESRTEMGFYDTLGLVHRAERCLECHLGTDTKQVTHQMMAAGHPPLTFELAADLEKVPRHWRDEQAYLPNTNESSFFNARVWAVGQAVALRESAYRIAHWAAGSAKTDFAMMECYSCHHDLTAPVWRQKRQIVGTLGEPMVELAPWAMCRPLVEMFMPDQRSEFEQAVEGLVRSVSINASDRVQSQLAATRLATLANQLCDKVAATPIDRTRVPQLLKRITADADFIAGLGYRSALQAYLALDVLYRLSLLPADPKLRNDEGIRKALAEINDLLLDANEKERAANYDGDKFAAHLKSLGRLFDDQTSPGS